MSDALFSAVQLERPGHAGYRLDRIELYNWGTFDGRVWTFRPGGETALLTGDIGSGKSTIVDAITTLLLPANTIAYNKAAGAGTRERTLRSYVEGYFKSERTETTGRSRPIGLRSGKRSYSVILGVFRNAGYDEAVTLAQVFWAGGQTGQPNRFYVATGGELSIADDFGGFGSDLNGLRRRLRSAGATVVDTYPRYATDMRRLLGIRSEQALDLFHQTVSMKSVGRLDDFVREHMLEPSDAADRVAGIIGHFENLTVAHDAVIRAREQLTALEPIVALADEYEAAAAAQTSTAQQRDGLRLFFAELRARLLRSEIVALRTQREAAVAQQTAAQTRRKQLDGERDELVEERGKAGGDRIGELERLAARARDEAGARSKARESFDAELAAAGLEAVDTEAGFARLTALIAAQRADLDRDKADLDARYNAAIVAESAAKSDHAALDAELNSLTARTSNLPPEQVEIREALCNSTGIAAADLPYAGELVDVADRFAAWRGAAERVLRPFALTMLVPGHHYDAVSSWVDANRLVVRDRRGGQVGGRLVYHRVPARRVAVHAPEHDGLWLLDCLTVRPGELEDYVRAELARRADFVCAETVSEFRAAQRAVTRQGQVHAGDRHEKDDRRRVDDPMHWVLGWANERKIAAMRGAVETATRALHEAEEAVRSAKKRRDTALARQQALSTLAVFTDWTALDVAEAEQRAESCDAERVRLIGGSTRLTEIDAALSDLERRRADCDRAYQQHTGDVERLSAALDRADRELAHDVATIDGADEALRAAERVAHEALVALLADDPPTAASNCRDAEAALAEALHRRIEALGKTLETVGQRLSKHMGDMLSRWPELRSDMDSAVESRSEFRTLHARVAADDLPSFQARFKEELNTNTINELAAFNNWLSEQRSTIDDRIAVINEGLHAVPYNPGRFIRLEKQTSPNSDIAAFRSDLRSLTDDALSADGGQYSEQRFVEVKRIIERFRGREGFAELDKAWTRRVTDVRNWFVFSASERVESTGEEWEHYSDSDGKSGGQKEKLAYTILAASLAYQFGLEWGAQRAKDFRFAVIDEAFGRGSDESTRYALTLFARLGLQLLIVTPLQKVHVIEPFVRAIGFVDNVTGTASRVHTMTIEEYRQARDDRAKATVT